MTAANSLTDIRVISLANAGERRKLFKRRASQTSLNWRFFDALTNIHPDQSFDSVKVRSSYGRELTGGEIGCFSSHFALWKSLLDGSAKQLIVLEDDVICDWALFEELSRFDLTNEQVDFLRLSYKYPVPSIVRQRRFLTDRHQLIELFGFAKGTQSYILTRSGARAMIEACREIEMPIDDQMDRSWHHGVPNLSLFPPMVLEEYAPSEIGDDRYGDHLAATRIAEFRAQQNKAFKRHYRAERLKQTLKRRLPGAS